MAVSSILRRPGQREFRVSFTDGSEVKVNGTKAECVLAFRREREEVEVRIPRESKLRDTLQVATSRIAGGEELGLERKEQLLLLEFRGEIVKKSSPEALAGAQKELALLREWVELPGGLRRFLASSRQQIDETEWDFLNKQAEESRRAAAART